MEYGGMTRAALIMACVSGAAALGGAFIVTRPTTSPQSVYIKRIAGTMCFSGALILALFAWGLEKAATPAPERVSSALVAPLFSARAALVLQ